MFRKRVYGGSFMPAAKRFKSGTRGRMRFPGTYRPKISSRAPVRTQLGQIARALRQTAPELKYVDVDVSAANVTTAGQVAYATAIAQGDSVGTRDGESVRLKSLSFKGRVTFPVNTSLADNFYSRVFVFRDKQNAQASPTVAQLVDNASTPELARPALDSIDRFTLLWASPIYDHRRCVADSDVSAVAVPTQSPFWDWEWHGDSQVRYFGANATDLSKNPVFVVYITSDSSGVIDFVGSMRLGFTDG